MKKLYASKEFTQEIIHEGFEMYKNIKLNLERLKSITFFAETGLSEAQEQKFQFGIEILENSSDAIQDYRKFGISKRNGLRQLKLYGLIQAMRMQENIIIEIYKVFDFYPPEIDTQLQELWDITVGQPLNSNNGVLCSSLDTFFDNYQVSYGQYDILQGKKRLDRVINYNQIVLEHFKRVDSYLIGLIEEVVKKYPSRDIDKYDY